MKYFISLVFLLQTGCATFQQRNKDNALNQSQIFCEKVFKNAGITSIQSESDSVKIAYTNCISSSYNPYYHPTYNNSMPMSVGLIAVAGMVFALISEKF